MNDDLSNNSDAVKNYTSHVENVQIVFRRQFLLQLSIVLVSIRSFSWLNLLFFKPTDFSFFKDNKLVQIWSSQSEYEISSFKTSYVGSYTCLGGNGDVPQSSHSGFGAQLVLSEGMLLHINNCNALR